MGGGVSTEVSEVVNQRLKNIPLGKGGGGGAFKGSAGFDGPPHASALLSPARLEPPVFCLFRNGFVVEPVASFSCELAGVYPFGPTLNDSGRSIVPGCFCFSSPSSVQAFSSASESKLIAEVGVVGNGADVGVARLEGWGTGLRVTILNGGLVWRKDRLVSL